MLTAKDIREVRFTKTMGGYKAAEVDDFLDLCVETVEAMQAQIDKDKQKMQVLAESIVEYRKQEDTIRTALITAQKAADSIIEEARQRAAAITDGADEEAELMREKALLDTEAEQKELQRVRREVADFKSKLFAIYREHLTLIGALEGDAAEENMPVAAPQEAPAEAPPEPARAPKTPDIPDGSNEPLPDFSAFALAEDE